MKAPVLFVMLATLLAAGCDSPRNTVESLQREIGAYSGDPSEAASDRIDNLFARLDGQIAKLREAGRTEQAADFSRQRDALQAQFATARLTATLLKAKQAAEGLGEAFRQAGESLGEALRAPAATPAPVAEPE